MDIKQLPPLARDSQGNPFVPPAEVVAWRVRRAPIGRGRPKNVYDADGGQLDVPLGVTVADLREAGCKPGRYRLDGVDQDACVVFGVYAVVEIVTDDGEPADEIEIAERTSMPAERDRYLTSIERLTDTNSRALEALARAFGPVAPSPMDAAMWRDAHGDDDDSDEPKAKDPTKSDDINSIVATVLKLVVSWMDAKNNIPGAAKVATVVASAATEGGTP